MLWRRHRTVMVAGLMAAAAMLAADRPVVSGQAPAAAPTGMVIGSRSYSPMVADLDRSVAFFRGVIGMSVPPPPEPGPYPWTHEPWHRDLHGLPESPMRFSTLTMPAALIPGPRMLVEPVQQGAIPLKPVVARAQDPGAFTFIVVVRDLDAAFARVKQAGVPVLTSGGAPVAVPAYGGKSRAVIVRDPDGQLVELVQLDPAPASTAEAGENLLGARLRITVEDMDRTLRLYRDMFGLSFEEASFANDPAMNRLMGVQGAQFRVSTTRIPQSNQHLEFLEARGVDRTTLRSRIQDPGSVRFQVTTQNLDRAIEMLRSAGPSTIVSNTGRALPDGSWEKGIIDTGAVRWLTVTDLNNVFLILSDRGTAPPQGRGGRGGRGGNE